jgi:hypothetical protein
MWTGTSFSSFDHCCNTNAYAQKVHNKYNWMNEYTKQVSEIICEQSIVSIPMEIYTLVEETDMNQ